MCLTARTVDAAEARELRLAELVVLAVASRPAVADLTAALLATDAATAKATKELLGMASRHSLRPSSRRPNAGPRWIRRANGSGVSTARAGTPWVRCRLTPARTRSPRRLPRS